MYLIHGKPIEDINEQDFLSLIESKTPESKFIEYKLTLPDNSDKDKKEFLADVSSFSNAAGGHIIFGISAKKGIPHQLVGLQNVDPDSEILRMDNMLRDAIAPRLPGIKLKSVPLKNGSSVIVLHISRSWIAPHMVTYAGGTKFFSRNSAGKYQLDVFELRTAFSMTNIESNRIRDFRIDRLAKITAGETPIPMDDGPRIVLHVVPFGAFDFRHQFDLTKMPEYSESFVPIGANFRSNFRFNFDGVIAFERSGNQQDTASTYLQLFRNGIIEASTTTLFTYKNDIPCIISIPFEEDLVEALKRYLNIYRKLEIEPPFLIMLSVLGVSGYALPHKSHDYVGVHFHMIDRNDLIVPEIFADDLNQPPDKIIRPAIDAVWNSAGLKGSPYYDANDNWNTKR
jgi:hypothetical protein